MPEITKRGFTRSGRISCSFCGVGDGGRPGASQAPAADSAPMPRTSRPPVQVSGRDTPFDGATLDAGVLRCSPPRAAEWRGRRRAWRFRGGPGGAFRFVGREIERNRDPHRATRGARLPMVRWTPQHVPRGRARHGADLGVREAPSLDDAPATGLHPAIRPRVFSARRAEASRADRATPRRSRSSRACSSTTGRPRRTLVCAGGQVDHFAVFALQEVLRLLEVTATSPGTRSVASTAGASSL